MLKLKRCPRCDISKSLDNFAKGSKNADGLQRWCNACRTQRRLELANTREVKQKVCKDCGELKDIDLFNRSNVMRDGHQARCYGCYLAKYGPAKKRRVRELQRTPKGWARAAFYNARGRAKAENVPFSLSMDDLSLPAVCPVLGMPLVLASKGMRPASPTLDRVLPELGYVKDNVVVISWLANKTKSDLTDPVIFEKIAAYIRQQQRRKD